jgi:hypothetical protein
MISSYAFEFAYHRAPLRLGLHRLSKTTLKTPLSSFGFPLRRLPVLNGIYDAVILSVLSDLGFPGAKLHFLEVVPAEE